MKQRYLSHLMLAGVIASLSACSTNDDSDDGDTASGDITANPNPPFASDDTIRYGFALTRDPDTDTARIVRISLNDGNTIDGQYPATQGNPVVTTDGELVYQVGTSDDTLTRFSPIDTSSADYALSVLNERLESGNPHALAFLSDEVAYLTRNSADSLLILDPTPDVLTPEALIRGTISLDAYNRGAGESLDLPDMSDAVVVDDKLFVLLENLDGDSPALPGYIAVIDTRTGLEIDTLRGVFPLKGIELQTVNPSALQYNQDTGLLYVVGRGNFSDDESVSGDAFSGGIESIDPVTYRSEIQIDDGTADENKGFFMDALVINTSLGYVITLDGINEDLVAINSLRTFNTLTGELSDPVAGTEELGFTSLALGPDNHVWVGVQDEVPGFLRIDIDTGELVGERVATEMIPDDIVFLEIESQ